MTLQQTRHHALKGAFDWERFGKALTKEIKRRETSITVMHEATGISRNMFYELMRGHPCGVELFLFMCEKFNLNPWDYFHK